MIFWYFLGRISNYTFVLISKISPGVKKDPFPPRKGYKNVSADGGLRDSLRFVGSISETIDFLTNSCSQAIVTLLCPFDNKHCDLVPASSS